MWSENPISGVEGGLLISIIRGGSRESEKDSLLESAVGMVEVMLCFVIYLIRSQCYSPPPPIHLPSPFPIHTLTLPPPHPSISLYPPLLPAISLGVAIR